MLDVTLGDGFLIHRIGPHDWEPMWAIFYLWAAFRIGFPALLAGLFVVCAVAELRARRAGR